MKWAEKEETARGYADFSTSIGLTFGSLRGGTTGSSGAVSNVWWKSPAFDAGVTPDMELISVNGLAYSAAVLRTAIVDAEKSSAPLQMIFKRGDRVQTIAIDYHGGLRYPSLQRVDGTPDRLDEIFAPSTSPLPAK